FERSCRSILRRGVNSEEEAVVTIQRYLVALLMLVAVSGTAAAQSGSGVAAIEGTVVDPDTRPVAGALVILISAETTYVRTAYTDARGRYSVSGMPVGTYSMGVSAA